MSECVSVCVLVRRDGLATHPQCTRLVPQVPWDMTQAGIENERVSERDSQCLWLRLGIGILWDGFHFQVNGVYYLSESLLFEQMKPRKFV